MIDIVERVELLFEIYESAEIKTIVFTQTSKKLLQYNKKVKKKKKTAHPDYI